MVRETGGMIGLRTAPEEVNTYEPSAVANTCHGSARSFAQAYDFGRLGLKVALGLGSDFNGFIQQTRPASALTPAPPPSPRRRSARRETSAAKDCHLSL